MYKYAVYGTIGGGFVGFRSAKYFIDRNKRISITNCCIQGFIGFIGCEAFPIAAPIIVSVVAYESYKKHQKVNNVKD